MSVGFNPQSYADFVTTAHSITEKGRVFYWTNGTSATRLVFVANSFNFLMNIDLTTGLPSSFSTDFPSAIQLTVDFPPWFLG